MRFLYTKWYNNVNTFLNDLMNDKTATDEDIRRIRWAVDNAVRTLADKHSLDIQTFLDALRFVQTTKSAWVTWQELERRINEKFWPNSERIKSALWQYLQPTTQQKPQTTPTTTITQQEPQTTQTQTQKQARQQETYETIKKNIIDLFNLEQKEAENIFNFVSAKNTEQLNEIKKSLAQYLDKTDAHARQIEENVKERLDNIEKTKQEILQTLNTIWPLQERLTRINSAATRDAIIKRLLDMGLSRAEAENAADAKIAELSEQTRRTIDQNKMQLAMQTASVLDWAAAAKDEILQAKKEWILLRWQAAQLALDLETQALNIFYNTTTDAWLKTVAAAKIKWLDALQNIELQRLGELLEIDLTNKNTQYALQKLLEKTPINVLATIDPNRLSSVINSVAKWEKTLEEWLSDIGVEFWKTGYQETLLNLEGKKINLQQAKQAIEMNEIIKQNNILLNKSQEIKNAMEWLYLALEKELLPSKINIWKTEADMQKLKLDTAKYELGRAQEIDAINKILSTQKVAQEKLNTELIKQKLLAAAKEIKALDIQNKYANAQAELDLRTRELNILSQKFNQEVAKYQLEAERKKWEFELAQARATLPKELALMEEEIKTKKLQNEYLQKQIKQIEQQASDLNNLLTKIEPALRAIEQQNSGLQNNRPQEIQKIIPPENIFFDNWKLKINYNGKIIEKPVAYTLEKDAKKIQEILKTKWVVVQAQNIYNISQTGSWTYLVKWARYVFLIKNLQTSSPSLSILTNDNISLIL